MQLKLGHPDVDSRSLIYDDLSDTATVRISESNNSGPNVNIDRKYIGKKNKTT